jgi:hypothetical protein
VEGGEMEGGALVIVFGSYGRKPKIRKEGESCPKIAA